MPHEMHALYKCGLNDIARIIVHIAMYFKIESNGNNGRFFSLCIQANLENGIVFKLRGNKNATCLVHTIETH